VPADGGEIHPYFEKCSALYAAAHFRCIAFYGCARNSPQILSIAW
jgi:hypothetical protein